MFIKRTSGFTLVEISIVLVIIGLITGGIILGQTLIRSSELRSIVTDWEKFEAARMTFRSKYNCAPGDCPFALSLELGNNGNGNGYVDHYSYNNEAYQFWQHLANAKLISGNYTGVGSSMPVLEENIPPSRISNVGYSLYTPAPAQTSWTPNLIGNGLPRALTDTMYIAGKIGFHLTYGGFLSPIEARNLDNKYDDGKANDGKIRSGVGWAPVNTIGCTTGSSPNYSYNNDPASLCSLHYWFHNL